MTGVTHCRGLERCKQQQVALQALLCQQPLQAGGIAQQRAVGYDHGPRRGRDIVWEGRGAFKRKREGGLPPGSD